MAAHYMARVRVNESTRTIFKNPTPHIPTLIGYTYRERECRSQAAAHTHKYARYDFNCSNALPKDFTHSIYAPA